MRVNHPELTVRPASTPAAGCNCTICPLYVDNPAATNPVCSGRNNDCSYCSCASAPSGCGTCPVRCGSRVDIGAWVGDVGGRFDFDDIELNQPEWPQSVPRFVPQLDCDTVDMFDSVSNWPAYAIGLRRMWSKKSLRLLPRWAGKTAMEGMELPADKGAVLSMYAEDPLVEAWWSRRHSDGLISQVAAQEWDVVLAPNFSVYGNQPRAEHLLNMRRSLMVAQELQEACGGRTVVVPSVYAFRVEDARRWADWASSTEPTAVGVNCQTVRTDEDWSAMVGSLTYLAAAFATVAPDTRFVVTGTSRPARIAGLRELLGDRLVIVSQNAAQLARRGAVMTAAGRRDYHALPADAFAASCRFYASAVD